LLVSRWLLDTIGVIVALLCGVAYFFFTFASAWDSSGSVASIAVWVVLSVIILSVFAILNLVLRPMRWWLYPLAFSTLSIIFGVLGLRDPAGPTFLWVGVALFTVVAALGSSYVTRRVSSVIARSNNRPFTVPSNDC